MIGPKSERREFNGSLVPQGDYTMTTLQDFLTSFLPQVKSGTIKRIESETADGHTTIYTVKDGIRIDITPNKGQS